MRIKRERSKQKMRTKVPMSVLLVVFLILLVLVGSQIMAMRAQNPPDKSKMAEGYPVVDYGASLPADAEGRSKREKANRSYDRQRLVTKDPLGTEVLIMNDYLSEIPALPVQVSSAVVLGNVSDAQAFLSNDKTGVYSEFTVQLEKVFKDDKDAPLNPGSAIKTDRLGGRVRHSANQTVWYHISGQSMPEPGKKYLFFLRRQPDSENYSIITAYELRSGRVHPLDGNQPSSSFAGAAYENAEERTFLSKVQEAVAMALAQGKP